MFIFEEFMVTLGRIASARIRIKHEEDGATFGVLEQRGHPSALNMLKISIAKRGDDAG